MKTSIDHQSKSFEEKTDVKSKEIIEKLDIVQALIEEETKQR